MGYRRVSEITTAPIPLNREINGKEAGAVVDFFGVVRDTEEQNQISGIEYTCYREMAERTLREIIESGAEKFTFAHGVRIVHRVGFVEAGIPSLLIQVESAHSAPALEALSFYLSEVKRLAPVWKEPRLVSHKK